MSYLVLFLSLFAFVVALKRESYSSDIITSRPTPRLSEGMSLKRLKRARFIGVRRLFVGVVYEGKKGYGGEDHKVVEAHDAFLFVSFGERISYRCSMDV